MSCSATMKNRRRNAPPLVFSLAFDGGQGAPSVQPVAAVSTSHDAPCCIFTHTPPPPQLRTLTPSASRSAFRHLHIFPPSPSPLKCTSWSGVGMLQLAQKLWPLLNQKYHEVPEAFLESDFCTVVEEHTLPSFQWKRTVWSKESRSPEHPPLASMTRRHPLAAIRSSAHFW